MSYARRAVDGSDVYVYLARWGFVCNNCHVLYDNYLTPTHYIARSTAEMVDHLEQHRQRGDTVPDYTFTDLLADQAENDPEVA